MSAVNDRLGPEPTTKLPAQSHPAQSGRAASLFSDLPAETSEQHPGFLGTGRFELGRLPEVAFRRRTIAEGKCNLTCMTKQLCIANADGQGSFDLRAPLLVAAVQVERPSVGIERVNVVAPRELGLRDLQRLGGLLGVV